MQICINMLITLIIQRFQPSANGVHGEIVMLHAFKMDLSQRLQMEQERDLYKKKGQTVVVAQIKHVQRIAQVCHCVLN